jgi:hypothetical protein
MRGEEFGKLDGGCGSDRGHTKVCPGSRPLGGGLLHPASNLIYDHSVYREPSLAEGCLSNLLYCICLSSGTSGGFIYAAS